MNARLEKLHDSLPHEAFSTCSHHLPPNLADLDFYHNFYHKINHNCGLGAQGKLSERTWHYPRCTGLPCSGGSLPQKQNSKLGGASPKVSIPYRKFFKNEPLQANFKGRGPGRAPGCLQASGKLLQCGKLSWGREGPPSQPS